jgi:hypothetical protein
VVHLMSTVKGIFSVEFIFENCCEEFENNI